MAKANEAAMDNLHGALCGYFLKLIGGEIPELTEATVSKTDPETGEVSTYKAWVHTGHMLRPSAGEVAVMAKFLKDNAIVGVAAEGSELSDLQTKLAERHSRRKGLPTKRDVADAMRELGTDLIQ